MEDKQTIFIAKDEAREEKIKAKPVPEREAGLPEAGNELLEAYRLQAKEEAAKAPEPTVHVSEILGTIAFIYEQIRNVIDYKKEHLLRRNAIERIIKRRLREKPGIGTKHLAHSLVRELIWARYLKNDSLPKSKVDEISRVLAKYFNLLNPTPNKDKGLKPTNQWKEWVLGVASCEVEEVIAPDLFYIAAYVRAMHRWFKDNFSWEAENSSPETRDIQLFIAIHRALPKSDEEMIRYHLLNLYYPDWKKASSKLIEEVGENLFRLRKEIESQLHHPIRFSLYRYVQKHTAPFQILKDIIDEDYKKAEALIANPEKLEWKVREICRNRYSQIRQKVNRGIIHSIVYIFITKALFAFILEIPYELYILKSLAPMPLLINAIIPPALMFLVGLTIKTPDEANTERIIQRIKSFVYPSQEEKTSFTLGPTKRSQLLTTIFSVLYLLLFILMFGSISYLLLRLNFNIISGLIFFVFLSLVLLFGFRVRFTASELIVTGEREDLFGYFLNILSLPFLNLGVWLSKGIARLNFLMILMDFIIEAPLKTIIAILEELTSFLRERREEVVEIPMQ